MATDKKSQKEKIKHALESGSTIDPSWAWNKVGCSKLSTRLGEMERDGEIPFVHRYNKTVKGKTFKIYSLKRLKEYEKTLN